MFEQHSALWTYLVPYLFVYFFLILQILQNKFDDFKHRIEAGSERFTQCEELAQKLIASESPYAADIECREEQLRWVVCYMVSDKLIEHNLCVILVT